MATNAALYLGSAAHQSLNHKESMHGKEAMVIDFPILHLDKEFNDSIFGFNNTLS